EELYQYIYKAALSISSRDRVTQEVLESYIKSDKEIHDKEKKIFLQSVEDLYDEDDAGSNISLEVLKKKKAEKEFLTTVSRSVKAFKDGQDIKDVLSVLKDKVAFIEA